jgi:hypothetical protein
MRHACTTRGHDPLGPIRIGGITVKKNLNLLAALALAAAVSPAAFAQQDQTAPPKNEPQAQTAPASDTSASSQAQGSFSGTVAKTGKHYVLKTESGTYQLDDQAKAKQFAGKQVTVSGTLDRSSGKIRVSDIQPAS